MIFVCENNGYGEWTTYERLTAGSGIGSGAGRTASRAYEVDGNDVLAVRDVTAEAVRRPPEAGRRSIEARTYIHCGHMEGEEVISGKYRSEEEMTSWEIRDPILVSVPAC